MWESNLSIKGNIIFDVFTLIHSMNKKLLNIIFKAISFSLCLFLLTNIKANNEKENWVDSVFNTLTIEQKIGQLFMVAAYSNKDLSHEKEISKLIEEFHIGGLIFYQGSI